MTVRTALRLTLHCAVVAFGTLLHVADAEAACNVIPGTANTFRSALGSVNRPFVGAASDAHTLAGPMTIAVTSAGSPLPCSLASARCADSLGTAGLVACVDELYVVDGTCRRDVAGVDPTFGHLTALPLANDYQ